jgi:type I restriction enzyme M protein
MVQVIKPQAGELIQDPAAGTGGFLIVADRYIKDHTDELFDLDSAQQTFQKRWALVGMELVADAQRLALMNCMLHDIEGGAAGPVWLGSTLSAEGLRLPKADVILTNPPLRHQEGRRPADARRLHLSPPATSSLPSCSTSTAASSPAAGPQWCCLTTSSSRKASAGRSAPT